VYTRTLTDLSMLPPCHFYLLASFVLIWLDRRVETVFCVWLFHNPLRSQSLYLTHNTYSLAFICLLGIGSVQIRTQEFHFLKTNFVLAVFWCVSACTQKCIDRLLLSVLISLIWPL
jgi:hypothetical protein